MTLCLIIFTHGGGSDSIVIGLRLQALCIMMQMYLIAIDVRRGCVVNVFGYGEWRGGLCYSITGSRGGFNGDVLLYDGRWGLLYSNVSYLISGGVVVVAQRDRSYKR